MKRRWRKTRKEKRKKPKKERIIKRRIQLAP